MQQHLINIPPSFADLFRKLFIDINKDVTIEAIIGYGSFFMKQSSQNSDIDLIVLTKTPIHQKKIIQIGQQDFEVFYFGVEKLARILREFDECYVPAMADGTILYDPNGLAVEVIKMAKLIYQKGPKDFTKSQQFMNKLRSRARTHIFDMRDSLSNPMLFNVCHYRLLFIIYRLICTQYKEWECSPKQMFDHIGQLSPQLHDSIQISLNDENYKTRLEVTENFVEKLLQPYGGFLQYNESVIY